MAAPDANDVTRLLRRMAQGDESAPAELLPHLYEQLRGIAELLMAQQSPSHTLQPTALVHEAWMRMSGGDYEGREHFAAVAARAMRSVLVDHARRKRAEKRGGAALRVPADLLLERIEEEGADVLALEDALERLGARDPELLRIVELRFFGGLEVSETAHALGVSESTVEREWRAARAWLYRRLSA